MFKLPQHCKWILLMEYLDKVSLIVHELPNKKKLFNIKYRLEILADY